MPVQRAGEHPGSPAPTAKASTLNTRDVLAGHRGHLLVVADGAEHAAERRRRSALEHDQRDGDDGGDDGQVDAD